MSTKRSNRREPPAEVAEALRAAAATQDAAAAAALRTAVEHLRSAQRIEALLHAGLATRTRRIVS